MLALSLNKRIIIAWRKGSAKREGLQLQVEMGAAPGERTINLNARGAIAIPTAA